ncbi:MAG: polysaccharide deacetylase family protein [Rhodoferax sp.]|uniref:polysaccharide deacetylase family protein n=1 Tax=Rhodoferax sp. TaxID=50421 RepID=UPI0027281A0A|nr:polysaccharide deacetylase family protein [Rhodoferax sp.]MDO8448172.1 polysaccharide deacetylase family protein [Rhodoferax sp.]
MSEIRWRPTLLIRATLLLHGAAVALVAVSPVHWRWVLAALVANHFVLMLVGLWPRSHWMGANWTELPAAAAARREIALTIDDGPDPVVTPQVLEVLARYGVQATFFVIGARAERYPELCRDIVARGHAIENHSQRHRHNFALMGLNGITQELQAAQATLTAITGQRPLFFRAPAGFRNPFLDPVLSRLGLQLVSWSVRGFDTRVNNAQQVTRKLLAGLRPGAIVLLHDGNAARTPAGQPVILEVLPALFDAAAARQLRFVTLRQV